MTAPELQPRYRSWRRGLLWLVATLLCVAVAAQTPAGSVNRQALLTPLTTLSGAFIAAAPGPISALAHKTLFSGYLAWLSPTAVAMDRFNRVFVSDNFDNTRKVYEQGQLVTSVGGSGAIPASFNQITSLWIDLNMLYVVDRLNARIQTFHVAPPAVKGSAHD